MMRCLVRCGVLLCAVAFAGTARGDDAEGRKLALPAPPAPPEDVTAAFGPFITPDRIIDQRLGLDSSTASNASTIHVLEDGRALWIGVEPRANLWRILVYFWPEFAIALLLLLWPLPVWRLWRIWRRPRAVGEPYCRKCNYQLTGSASPTCPECGARLTAKTIITGRSRKGRAVPAAACALVILACLTTLALLWDAPRAFGWWAVEHRLPREGSVSQWFEWDSAAAFRWAERNELDMYGWFYGERKAFAQVWLVSLHTGAFERLLHEYEFKSGMDGNVADSPSFHYVDVQYLSPRQATPRIIDRESWHAIDLATFIIKRVEWEQDVKWWESFHGDPGDCRFSFDGEFFFDGVTYDRLVAWRVSDWAVYWPFPLHHDGTAPDKRPVVTRIIPVAGEPAAVIRYGEGNDEAATIWWPGRAERIDVPKEWINYGLRRYVFAGNGRYLIGEQEYLDGGWQLAWDFQANQAAEEIDLRAFTGVPVDDRKVYLAAASRTQPKAYLYGANTDARWYVWDIPTGAITALDAAPGAGGGDLIWVRTPQELMNPPIKSDKPGREIKLTNWLTDAPIDSFAAPGPIWLYDLGFYLTSRQVVPNSPDGRFYIAQTEYRSVAVIFDRTTRKWLGRFGGPHLLDSVREIFWSDGGRTLAVIGEWKDQPRMLVYDMSRIAPQPD